MLRERLLESGNEQANLMRAVYTDGVELSRKVREGEEGGWEQGGFVLRG